MAICAYIIDKTFREDSEHQKGHCCSYLKKDFFRHKSELPSCERVDMPQHLGVKNGLLQYHGDIICCTLYIRCTMCRHDNYGHFA